MMPSSTLPSKLCHCAKRSEAFSILESASFKYHRPRYTSLIIIDSRKNVHATIPKGSMGYDEYTVPDDCTWPFACCRFRDSSAGPSTHPLPPATIPSLYHSQKAGFAIVRPPSPATYSVNSFDSVPVGSSVDNLLLYSLLLHSFLPVSQQKGLPVSLFPTYGISQ